MSTLERAIAIAAEAHAGEVDKAGAPYIHHPLRVMDGCEGAEAKIVAVLHDLVEDTDWTLEGLRAEGFSEAVVSGVDAVTRRDGEVYLEFVARARAHPLGREVKRADVLENLDIGRIAEPKLQDYRRLVRYVKALAVLDGFELEDVRGW